MSIYRDVDFQSFEDPNPFSGDLTVLTDDRDIVNTLSNTVMVDFEETFYQNIEKESIKGALFETDNIIVRKLISDIINKASLYDSRIESVDNITIEQLDETNTWNINVEITVNYLTNNVENKINFSLLIDNR